MLVLGIGIVSTGIVIELGDSTINATTDVISVVPTTNTYDWLNAIVGNGLLLLGLFGFFQSIINYDKSRNSLGRSNW